MDLQSLFYIVAIVFMLMIIVSFIFLGYMVWKFEKAIRELPETAAEKVKSFVEQHSGGMSGVVGMTVLSLVLKGIKKRFERKD